MPVDTHSLCAARTLLFVPGHRPQLFAKAVASGADGIVLDLEDGVAPEEKDYARVNVRNWILSGGVGIVRVNGPESTGYDEDVAALSDRPVAVMLPKVKAPEQVVDLLKALPHGSVVIPLIEAAGAVLDARAICAVRGVVRAALGNGDLAAELGVDHADRDALLFARASVVLASAAAKVAPPIDGVTTVIGDEQVLVADTLYAASLGFTGRLCIHPSQIASVHATLAPSEGEFRRAEAILAAASTGSATVVDGAMVDRPIVERARRVAQRR